MPRPFLVPARRALPCAAALAAATLACADPADYVFVPYPNAGARYVSWSGGAEAGRGGERERQQSIALGWSPTSRWYTSLYGAWASTDGGGYAIDEVSWVNHVAVTQPGAGPVDVGVLCEVSRPHDRAAGTGFTCGPTLQLDTEDLQVNLNPLVEKQVDAQDAGPASLRYQWQVKGLWRPGVELGAQGFGDLGPWNHWAAAGQQSHTLGPAVFMKWMMADGHALALDAAWLVGLGGGSPRNVLRLRLQHEF